MINIRYLIFIILFFPLFNCSFDKKTGIWTGNEKELERIEELEKASKKNRVKIFSTFQESIKEISYARNVTLGKAERNTSWVTSGLNIQNSSGNLYLKSINEKFLKKRIGKNKFDIFQRMQSPLFYENNIILSDDKGTLFRINKKGKIYWKVNIYKKIYKKLYKNLTFTLHNNYIYVADNIGFVYVINYENGNLAWKKNLGIPTKSYIKVFNNKIYIVDQDNKILCLDAQNGKKIWDILTIKTFIKSQSLLGLAISKEGHLVVINSAGDVLKINSENGRILWTMNSLFSLSSFDSDFFKTSDVVINNNDIIFSNVSSTFSININNGFINWVNKVKSSLRPIVSGDNVFLVTDNGYYINLNRKNGQVIWITNVLKILKKKKQSTIVTGFIVGSEKTYITTSNGYLIVCSATNGEVKYEKKLAKSINSPPIISNAELYVLTGSSQILGFR